MRLFVILIVLGLTGCTSFDSVGEGLSGITDYFLGGTDNADPPNPLVEYSPELELEVLWKKSVGVGADKQSLKLVPSVASGKIVTADREGLVQARKVSDGDLIWETETDLYISGGPGLGVVSVILGTSDAEVVALNMETGDIIWKSPVSSEVLSVPVIANGIVIIRTTDGAMTALDEKTGQRLWSYERNVPALSIRGISSPIIIEENVISGEDNGKLIALRLSDGKFVWETSVALPKGRSEIERLVDLDADPIESGGVIYVASYHGGIGAVSELNGDVLWRKEDISTNSGISTDNRYLYISDSESHVMQLDHLTGSPLWKQKDLHQRMLTAPAAYKDYVVVGDFEGYVHWLSTVDGRQLARIKISDGAIDARPLVVDNTVFVYAQDGALAALTVR